ncbi:hypothetical protein K7X08_026506 [Anisodus acutangulus]|uniref:Piwi domain-containing protein n=1 Tax=Anisodus acutangulus TaxID=402998 RepID=A0A9Q1LQX9_9SOLA|nr:hypothetical protein K7X08_026506 [Anisodus acutangulus]
MNCSTTTKPHADRVHNSVNHPKFYGESKLERAFYGGSKIQQQGDGNNIGLHASSKVGCNNPRQSEVGGVQWPKERDSHSTLPQNSNQICPRNQVPSESIHKELYNSVKSNTKEASSTTHNPCKHEGKGEMGLVSDLIKCGKQKGIMVDDPFDVFEESPQVRRAPPLVRVEKMFEQVQSKLPGAPKFLLCLLSERKNGNVYGPWKRKNLIEYGIVTKCIAPTRVNDQYITNVLLKINAKLGGLNSMLTVEHSPSIHMVSKVPTIILGMDMSHGSPGQSDDLSIVAVVSSS